MRGQLFLADFALVRPVLSGEHGHADEHLRIVRHTLGRQFALLERDCQQLLDLHTDLAQQRAERASRVGGRRIAHEHLEAFGILLDVGEQRQRRAFHDLSRMVGGGGQRGRQGLGQRPHLAIDHHGVQPLLAAEVLVDNRFGHLGARRDLLHADRLEPLGCKERTSDADKLFAPLQRRHTRGIGHVHQCRRMRA